jgi:hypothetical protein
MKYIVKMRCTLTATYTFDVDSAEEAERCARFGFDKGYIEWDEDCKLEVAVKEATDEES